MMTVLVILLLVLLLAVETPIAFAVGIAAFFGLMLTGLGNAPISAQRMFSGMNSYGLLALPLFILAGNILVAGGVINRLVEFADRIVGRIRGGLAHANVVANLMMAGVSGSATADTAALGSVMTPMMTARGAVIFTPPKSRVTPRPSARIFWTWVTTPNLFCHKMTRRCSAPGKK